MISRGEIWWARIHAPVGSEPGYRRPVVVIQANSFNHSQLSTVLVVTLTSNLGRANAPGNLLLRSAESGLDKHSVANVSQVMTLDKSSLERRVRSIAPALMQRIEDGLRRVMAL